MSRRSKLVYLISLNAILASAVVALLTLLLASDRSPARVVACDADGPVTREGFVPVSNGFATIEAAEAFICHEVVYPRHTPDWQLEQISASRSGPAAYVGSGYGFASVTLDYKQPNRDTDLRIEVSPFRIDPIGYGIVDQVDVMGARADVIQGHDPNLYILQWQAHGFSFYAEAVMGEGFDLPALLAILNSIR